MMPPLQREPLRTPEEEVHHQVLTGALVPGSYAHANALLCAHGVSRAARRKRLRALGLKPRR